MFKIYTRTEIDDKSIEHNIEIDEEPTLTFSEKMRLIQLVLELEEE